MYLYNEMNTISKEPLFYTVINSSLCHIYIAFTKKGISRIVLNRLSEKDFVKTLRLNYQRPVKRDDRTLAQLKREIENYFAYGKQRVTAPTFKSNIDLIDGTPFEREVWLLIKRIPYGEVISYGDLAMAAGRPKAVRAVAMACKKNPLPIFIPCHRVIGKDRSLKGYSSKIYIKGRLLEIEGVSDIRL